MNVFVEILGYCASGLVALSFVMKSMRKLRFINIIGSVLFVIYSITIQAWPVALINTFVVGVNIYHLRRQEE